jgi:hypothetical protein
LSIQAMFELDAEPARARMHTHTAATTGALGDGVLQVFVHQISLHGEAASCNRQFRTRYLLLAKPERNA